MMHLVEIPIPGGHDIELLASCVPWRVTKRMISVARVERARHHARTYAEVQSLGDRLSAAQWREIALRALAELAEGGKLDDRVDLAFE